MRRVGEGILLKPVRLFPETALEEVAGCLNYQGPRRSLAEMETDVTVPVSEP